MKMSKKKKLKKKKKKDWAIVPKIPMDSIRNQHEQVSEFHDRHQESSIKHGSILSKKIAPMPLKPSITALK